MTITHQEFSTIVVNLKAEQTAKTLRLAALYLFTEKLIDPCLPDAEHHSTNLASVARECIEARCKELNLSFSDVLNAYSAIKQAGQLAADLHSIPA